VECLEPQQTYRAYFACTPARFQLYLHPLPALPAAHNKETLHMVLHKGTGLGSPTEHPLHGALATLAPANPQLHYLPPFMKKTVPVPPAKCSQGVKFASVSQKAGFCVLFEGTGPGYEKRAGKHGSAAVTLRAVERP